MYVNPLYTHTNPELSKLLLTYRYNTLDQARNHAKELGHEKKAPYTLGEPLMDQKHPPIIHLVQLSTISTVTFLMPSIIMGWSVVTMNS